MSSGRGNSSLQTAAAGRGNGGTPSAGNAGGGYAYGAPPQQQQQGAGGRAGMWQPNNSPAGRGAMGQQQQPPQQLAGGPPPLSSLQQQQMMMQGGYDPRYYGGHPPPYGMHAQMGMMQGVPPGMRYNPMQQQGPNVGRGGGGPGGYGLVPGGVGGPMMQPQRPGIPQQYNNQGGRGGGGVQHYPMVQPGMNRGVAVGGGVVSPTASVPPQREKKVLVITDKNGNPIDFGKGKTTSTPATSIMPSPTTVSGSDAAAAPIDGVASAGVVVASTKGGIVGIEAKVSSLQIAASSSDAGNALRKAAMEAIAAGSAMKAREEAEKKHLQNNVESKKMDEEILAVSKVAAEAKAKEEAALAEAEHIEKERIELAEVKAREEAETRARREFEECKKVVAEEVAAHAKAEADPAAALQATKGVDADVAAEVTTPQKTESAVVPPSSTSPIQSSFRPGGFRPGVGTPSNTNGASVDAGVVVPNGGSSSSSSSARKPFIYSKQMLMSLRDEEYCVCRPEDLPDMTVKSGNGGAGGTVRRQNSGARGGGGGGSGMPPGGGGDDWSRGRSMPNTPGGGGNRFNDQAGGGGRGGGNEWNRGQAPPPQRPDQGGGRRQSNNRGDQDYYDDIDDDYAPLVRSENHWKPSKDNSVMAKVEKQMKSFLNKITKEKFDKLSAQICDIPILSYEMLTLVINLVYEKAISEPSFSDMYANLCYRLSQMAKKGTFIKIIESDEDPMAEEGADYSEGASGSVSYRWSNDVGTSDAEIMGPFENEQQSIDAASAGEDIEPVQRGELELTLHRLLIRRGTFIKIMHAASENKYYTVFFPIGQAVECGQQLSLEIFTSEIEAQNHATKMNTFKRSLLNKCEDEFKKQDIYTDWKSEKKEYEKNKADLSDKERKDKEEDFEFRKMKIKKQMLGNIKFIGELYKLGMLKVKIMRECIHSLLKLEEHDGGLRSQTGEDCEMDEEDHDALCNLFRTIGDTIDKSKNQPYMKVYFTKMDRLSNDKALSSRLRFMYKDLIEMRHKGWQLRREVETAKTLVEIKKDAEREERMAQMQSQQGGEGRGRGGGRGGYESSRGGGGGGGSRGYDGGRGGRGGDVRGYDNRAPDRNAASSGRSGHAPASIRAPPVVGGQGILPPCTVGAGASGGTVTGEVLAIEKLKLRAENMRKEWLQSKDEKELYLTADELLVTPGAGQTITQVNIDYAAADCKATELKPIIEMMVHLHKNKKVSTSDIESAMADLVEFIDSFACDNPHVFHYVGELFSAFANDNILTVDWLCDNANKVMGDEFKYKVVEEAIKSVRSNFGQDAVMSCFGGKNEIDAIEKLLGPTKAEVLTLLMK